MIRKYVKARWLFVIGLTIFMLDIYLFFQPSALAQSDAVLQPTANAVATVDNDADQAPASPVNDGGQTTPEPPPQSGATSEPAQVTGVPANTTPSEDEMPTQVGATSGPEQVTDVPVDGTPAEVVLVTQDALTAQPTDGAILSITETLQNQTTIALTEPTPSPSDAEATSEPTLASTSPIEVTNEATAEATVDTESTEEPTITETDVATREATEQVEATGEAAPLALQAVPLATEPDIELGVTCPSPGVASFTLRNVGGDMPAPGNYTVSNPPLNSTFQLRAGEFITFQAAGDANVTASYTTISGTQVSLGATGQCTGGPTATATLTPTRRPTLTPSNTPTITRTPTITLTPSITLTPTITLTASITPTPTITFTPSNTFTATATYTPSNTPLPTFTFTPSNTPTITLTPSITPTPTATATLRPGTPLIELNVACLPVAPGAAPQARFRLRNSGGDMLTAGTYTLTEPGKASQTNSFLLMAGQTQDLIAAGDSEVDVAYSTLILSTVTLGVTGTCTNTPTLTPTAPILAASSTPAPQVPPAPTAAPANPTDIPVPTATPTRVAFTNTAGLASGGAGSGGSTSQGQAQGGAGVNSAEVCGTANETLNNNFPVIDMMNSACNPQPTTLERPAWTPVTVGGAVCPDWLIYHTDMTGDWEIFRLGNLPGDIQADPNLSRGVGQRVYDLMPSRSPDQMWITFASNRDTNWEIYISAVAEENIERVTYSTDAVELDPAWSPVGGNIVYESNRDGNWNLYMFNVSTGLEKRITNWAGNEVNAAWSPDGKNIVFQSDEDGFWQIYEMDVSTLVYHRLSDGAGDDHGPQFAHDGQHIIFYSLREGFNSVIYSMDAEGGDVTLISDPAGNAINHAWSPDDRFIAYQSDADGDEDVYVYELDTQTTRQLTDNGINDYAPTWYCNAPIVAFTSDITGDSNIFSASVLPIQNQPIKVEESASQLTSDTASDQYPIDSPSEENASRENSLPSPVKNK